MWVRNNARHGMLRVAVVLIVAALTGPLACADDYVEIAVLARDANPLHESPGVAEAVTEAAEGYEAVEGGCSCSICVPVLVRSAFLPHTVLEEQPNPRLSAACCVESCFRPEVYRPPSI